MGLGVIAEPRILRDGLSVLFPSHLLLVTHGLHSVPVLPNVRAGSNALTGCEVPAFAILIRMSRDRAHGEKHSGGKKKRIIE